MRKRNKNRKVDISQRCKLKKGGKKEIKPDFKIHSFIGKKKKAFRFLLAFMVNQIYFLPCYNELVFKEVSGLIKN